LRREPSLRHPATRAGGSDDSTPAARPPRSPATRSSSPRLPVCFNARGRTGPSAPVCFSANIHR
jgi:hypothetical protein